MVGKLLLRGMLLGLFAGLLAFGFARVFGEPSVDRAIAFEEQHEAAHHEEAAHQDDHDVELVSRATQAGIGLLTGVVVFGTALGGLFALVFAFVYGRIGQLDARRTAALLALGGFVVLVLVPELKYPANPPAVGRPETIGYRTEFYFIMLALSLISAATATALTRGLWQRWGGWTATIIGAAVFIVLIGIVQIVLPPINEVPDGFSATVLWNFRIASLGIHAVLWTTFGVAFGLLAERSLGATTGTRLTASPAKR